MLIKDKKSGKLVAMNDVLARELVASGYAERAKRQRDGFAGSPVFAVEEDPREVIVDVPPDVTDVNPH